MVNVCPVCYAWWFWPVMPATWEAEAGSQGQYLSELYSEFKGNLGTLVRPCFKIKGEKRAGDIASGGYCEWRKCLTFTPEPGESPQNCKKKRLLRTQSRVSAIMCASHKFSKELVPRISKELKRTQGEKHHTVQPESERDLSKCFAEEKPQVTEREKIRHH